ncbi:TPA: hypothetical protein N0F65_002265 [Lagenidium giganteum]|uniref:AAA+ ATPase domain-containing protein n=1 Tax=Lagenidium giganteum TaxID=4803 RepID=A0AAV2YPC0_9STRA|nr:TPA: hypothetical protein N0F65_002265 [Lagenidium giganteum]
MHSTMERRKSVIGSPISHAASPTAASTAPKPLVLGSTDASECWDSLSYLESTFHYGFMRSRLRTGEFVYHENPRLTRDLDEYCDVDSMHQAKGPILLLGETGVGKSTFLSNWLVRRRKMFQNWQPSYPEFIFYHVVGCSRQSLLVSNLLERILREIKEFFELNKDIPEVEERLSWQFPRFLEAAARKGRVILIIDGLQRLRTNDGESILKWLPLSFPPNVRLIFSGTTNSSFTKLLGGGSAAVHERIALNAQMIERIKVEANRRNWTIVHVLPLLEEERRRITRKFLHKHDPSRQQGAGKQLPAAGPGSPTGRSDSFTKTRIIGFQMYELQQRALISLPLTANAQFLKVLLTCLAWAAQEGFNLHVVFEQWLSVDSLGQLFEAILRCMETGYLPDVQAMDDAKQFLKENSLSLFTNPPSPTSRRRTVIASKQVNTSPRNNSLPGQRSSEFEYVDTAGTGRPTTPLLRPLELTFSEVPSPGTKLQTLTRALTAEAHVAPLEATCETKELFVPAASTHGELQGDEMNGNNADGVDMSIRPSGMRPSSSTGVRTPFSLVTKGGDDTSVAQKSSSLDGVPTYLCGGQYVPGLGILLGKALSLLFVCRHGLLLNELRHILNGVVMEDRASQQTQYLHRKASFSNVRNMARERLTAFTEDEWKLLQRALRALGVLLVQEVLVLPICKETLREVIWWRYIGSEQAEQQYHHWLIRFFRIHPTTFRRVEELPWHLKRCYHWDALRNVLVNLPMFQLLYTANYKAELFGYWKTLSDGPLLVYDAHASSTDPPVYMAPFDIVREYGKSLEDWYKATKPTTKTFTRMLSLLTKFMYDFCQFYQGHLPAFNHTPFDLKSLHLDGFGFVEDLPHALSSNNAAAATASAASMGVGFLGAPMPMSAGMSAPASSSDSPLLVAIDSFNTLSNAQNAHHGASREREAPGNWFFYYQRWVWIHFPWLSLGKDILIKDATGAPIPSAANLTLATPHDGLGSALTSHTAFADKHFADSTTATPTLDPVTLDVDTNGDHGAVKSHAGHHRGSAVHLRHNSQKLVHRASVHFDPRFWDVKKSMFDTDGVLKRKMSTSPSKIKSLQHTSVVSQLPSTDTHQIVSPDNLFRKKSTYLAVKNVLASSVKSLPSSTLANSASMPTLPENATTFITEGEDAEHDNNDEQLELIPEIVVPALPPTNNTVVKTLLPSAAGMIKEAVISSINPNDAIANVSTAFGLPAHFQDYPQNEWHVKQSYNYQVVLKLQTMLDNVKIEVRKKQKQLQATKLKIRETKKRYEVTMREADMAKQAMEEMSSRMDKLESIIRNIDRQEKNHRRLLRGCEEFPACDPSHFATMKKELKLLQVKLKDLNDERKMLQLKKNHLQTMELPIIQKEVEKSKRLLSAVVEKLERSREKMAHEQASTDKLFQRRLEMIASVRKTAVSNAEAPMSEGEAAAAAEMATTASTRSLAAKVALQQCEAMCEKIQKATGFSKLEHILQKFVSREELNKSFEEQAKIYEARLKQIKMHQTDLEEQLHSLELSNATSITEDPRLLEEKLRVAEVELARVERTQNTYLTISKEIIAGAARVVKLMGITSCRTPHQDAIAAAQLWPPPLGFDGDSNLTTEFESLEPKDIANLLMVCQDRACAMIDMIEGGRGDPDSNFALINDLPAKTRSKGKEYNDKGHHHHHHSHHKGKKHTSLVVDNKKDVIGSIGTITLQEAPTTPEMEDEAMMAEVLTREAIKISSKNKVGQVKRRGGHSAHPTTGHHHAEQDNDG